MKFTEKQLLDALRELERPTSFWVLFRHVTLKNPEPPSDPDVLVHEIKTVLNIAVLKGLVEKKDNMYDMYCLAPRSEGDKATADGKGVVEQEAVDHEAGNVARMGSSKHEEIILPSFMALPKLTPQDKKSHARKRGGKRKLEIPAEIHNTVDNSGSKGLVEEKDGELIKPSLMVLPKLAHQDKKSHARKCGGKRKLEIPAEIHITVDNSGSKGLVEEKDGELIKPSLMALPKLAHEDKKSHARKRGGKRKLEIPAEIHNTVDNAGSKGLVEEKDGELIKPSLMVLPKLAHQDKKSHARKCGGKRKLEIPAEIHITVDNSGSKGLVEEKDGELIKPSLMALPKLAHEDKKSHARKRGGKRKLEIPAEIHNTVDNAGSKGLVEEKDGELIKPSLMALPKLAHEDKKSHARKRGGKRKLEIPAEIHNTVDNSGSKGLVEEKDGELIKPSLMVLPKLAHQDKKSHARKCGGKRKLEIPAEIHITVDNSGSKGLVEEKDGELIKPSLMALPKLAHEDKKSHARKRGGKRKLEIPAEIHNTVDNAGSKGLVEEKDGELIKPSLMALPKLAHQDKKSNAHKRGGKRKLEIPAEIDNTVDNSGSKGLVQEMDGELIKPKLARQVKKSHAPKCGRKPKQVSSADNIADISGTKRPRKKEGMYCLAPRSEGGQNTKDDKDDVEHKAGNVASVISAMDEELIKAAYMKCSILARQDKNSHAHKREGTNVANMVSPLAEEVIKEAFMEFTKLTRQDKKSQVQKHGRKRKQESAPEGTLPPKTSPPDDCDSGADAKDKRGRS